MSTLFTAWERRGDFAAAVDTVVDTYHDGGYTVEIAQRFDTFARLKVTDPAEPNHPYKVELAANWRSLPPVMMDVGPVLHIDDVVGGKMSSRIRRLFPDGIFIGRRSTKAVAGGAQGGGTRGAGGASARP